MHQKLNKMEAERILRKTEYWHYPFELPWGRVCATKPGHNERHWLRREHFFQPLLDLYGGSLRNKRVLDLGCCQGFWCIEARQAGAEYCLGIDSSKEFVSQAEALQTIFDLDQCEFRYAQLERDLWWNDLRQFHITLFLGLFYHLSDPMFVLRKAMNQTLETLVWDSVVAPQEDPVLVIVPRDLQEPTTCNSNISSLIRMVPSQSAIVELLKEGGFSQIEFLAPKANMPSDYLLGNRVTVIAQKGIS